MDRYSKSNKRKELKEKYAKWCNLYMEAQTTAKEVCLKLNSTTDSKKINELKKELKMLKRKITDYEAQRSIIYDKVKVNLKSEIPLLLFAINESRYSFNGIFEPKWEYVYYYADYDEIVKITRPGTLSLNENDVNLTDLFFDLGMPEELKEEGIEEKYDEVINKAVDTTKILIDQIFEENNITSWKDVSTHLKKYVDIKNKIDKIKGINHLKLI